MQTPNRIKERALKLLSRSIARGSLGLEGFGLEPGCHADMVALQADGPFEAIRLRAPRLQVIRRGGVIPETPEIKSQVRLDDMAVNVYFSRNLRRFIERRSG